METAASLIVRLGPAANSLPVAWCAFGPPPMSVYLPVVPVAELPAAYGPNGQTGSALWRALRALHDDSRHDGQLRAALRSALAGLQQQLDDLTHEFAAEADSLHRGSEAEELRRLAASFMQRCYEGFEDLAGSLGTHQPERVPPESEAELVLP
jgi:hypothetical protein